MIQKPAEQITERDIRRAFERLGPRAKYQFLCLRDNSGLQFQKFEGVFAESSFTQNSAATNTYQGIGLFVLASRFNHSCLPNAATPANEEEIVTLCATRDIMVGEEITFCYDSYTKMQNRRERHQTLEFVCDCKACLLGTPFQQLSDLRRRFCRGVQYLVHGVDLDGQKSSIIADPELKKAAENFRIPISARLIYNLLILCLLEAEGLMSDFMFERAFLAVVSISEQFGTASNLGL